MNYMGSKRRIAREILPVIFQGSNGYESYFEPFVGGANSIDRVRGNRQGSDVNKYLIAALKLIRDKPWVLPETYSHSCIDKWKSMKVYEGDDPLLAGLKGYYGFALSYGGQWFVGLRMRDPRGENYVREAYNAAQRQSKALRGCELVCCSYDALEFPENSIIYCDPPYESKLAYRAVEPFNHSDFWEWCREKTSEGHRVIVSEFNAPDDFSCIWEKEIKHYSSKTNNLKAFERLFVHESLESIWKRQSLSKFLS